jgi:hypothetical protein
MSRVGFQVELTHPVGADLLQQPAQREQRQDDDDGGENEPEPAGIAVREAAGRRQQQRLVGSGGAEDAEAQRETEAGATGPATPGTPHRELVPSPVVTTPATTPAGTAGLVDSAKRRSDRPTSADVDPTCGSRPLIRTCTQHRRGCECASVRITPASR